MKSIFICNRINSNLIYSRQLRDQYRKTFCFRMNSHISKYIMTRFLVHDLVAFNKYAPLR